MEKFGARAGLEMQKVLELTTEEIDAMADSAKAAGLVMSKTAVQAARDYEIGMANLSDTMQGFKLTVGNQVIPVVNDFIDVLNEAIADSTSFEASQKALDEAQKLGLITLRENAMLEGDLRWHRKEDSDVMEILRQRYETLAPPIDDVTGALIEERRALMDSTVASYEHATASDGVATAITGVTTALLGREQLEAYNKMLKEGTIDQDQYNEAARHIMTTLLDIPAAEAEANLAFGRLKDAYEEGRLTSEQYAAQVGILAGHLDYIASLDGRRINLYVDVQQTGGVNLPGGGFVDPGTGSTYGGARASGGPVEAGKSYLVGENGPEMLTMGKRGGGYVSTQTWNIYTNAGTSPYQRDYNWQKAMSR